MNCINNFAHKYAKATKQRGRLITIVISLSTILVFCLGMMVISTMTMWASYDQEVLGEFDSVYRNVTESQLQGIIDNSYIKQTGQEIGLGYIEGDVLARINYLDDIGIDGFNHKFIKGGYPQKANEIAVSENVLDYLGITNKIGGEIKLKYVDNLGNDISEDFILSGIVKNRENEIENEHGSIMVSDAYKDTISKDLHDIYVYLYTNSLFTSERKIYEIGGNLGITNDRISTPMMESMSGDLVLSCLAIALVIMLLAIVSITSIYSHSVIERINSIGLLKSIGMTKRQINKLFTKEAMQFLKKGIFYGFISSIVIMTGLIVLIAISSIQANIAGLDVFKIPITRNLSMGLFLITILIQILAMFISVKIPLRKATKLSIVECTDFVENNNIKRSKKRDSFIKNPVIRLAVIKLMSTKLKTILIIGCLSLSVSVFIAFSSLMNSMDDELLARQIVTGSMEMKSLASNEIKKSDFEQLSSLDGVEKTYTTKFITSLVHYTDIKIKSSFTNQLDQLNMTVDQGNEMLRTFTYGYDDNFLEYNDCYVSGNEALIYDQYGIGDYKIGDKITLNYEGMEAIVTISGFITDYIKNTYFTELTPVLIVNSQFLYDEFGVSGYNYLAMDIDDEYYDEYKQNIKDKYSSQENLSITFIDEAKESLKQEYLIIASMGYSLVGIVAFISFMMLINNIYASIINRKKEFGILRSIGMTGSQFDKLIKWEGNIYMAFIALIGLPIGYILARLINAGLASENSHIIWRFPYYSLLILVVYYIIILLVVKFSMAKIDKQSVSELIRYQ